MGAFSIWHILIVGAIALLVFGRPGRISGLMEDLGKGIRGFRKGMSDQDQPSEPPRQVQDQSNGDRTP